MIKFDKSPPVELPALPIVPLVDVTFYLLAFFIMTAEIINVQNDPRVELPAMSSPQLKTAQPADLVVNLLPDGQITAGTAAVTLDRLPAFVADRLSKARQDGQEIRVVVRADRTQRFAALDDVLAACRRAGLAQVVFRTRDQGDGS